MVGDGSDFLSTAGAWPVCNASWSRHLASVVLPRNDAGLQHRDGPRLRHDGSGIRFNRCAQRHLSPSRISSKCSPLRGFSRQLSLLGQEDSGSTSERHRNRLRERIYDVIRRRYKRVGGILNQCRMATAHRMPTDARFDRLSIGGVGLRIGLSDPSHFIRQCRKHLGMTPGKLRGQRESWSVDLLSRSQVRIAAR